jgi:hypothetical protein
MSELTSTTCAFNAPAAQSPASTGRKSFLTWKLLSGFTPREGAMKETFSFRVGGIVGLRRERLVKTPCIFGDPPRGLVKAQ